MHSQADQQAINFLKEHHLCGVTTIISNGEPHAEVLHYAVMDNPLTLFFCVDKRSFAVRNVSANDSMAVVVGWSEERPRTMQLHGKARIIKEASELAHAKAIYYAIRPHSQRYENDPHTVFIAFTPYEYRLLNPDADPALRDFFKRGLER